jgi:hypothetical protein
MENEKRNITFMTPGHFVSDCLVCQSYIADGKCKKNAKGKVVLLSGQYCPRSMPERQ